jgi:hypothetical protein
MNCEALPAGRGVANGRVTFTWKRGIQCEEENQSMDVAGPARICPGY